MKIIPKNKTIIQYKRGDIIRKVDPYNIGDLLKSSYGSIWKIIEIDPRIGGKLILIKITGGRIRKKIIHPKDPYYFYNWLLDKNYLKNVKKAGYYYNKSYGEWIKKKKNANK